MLDDFIRSVNSQINERFSSPLLGGFLISWCLWNYQFLVILFSENTVTETFFLIQSIAFPDRVAIFLSGFLYPLITTLIYVFIYPYPAKFVYRFTQQKQKEINEIRRQISNETMLTLEESRALRKSVDERIQEQMERFDKKERENEELTAELTNLRSEFKQLKSRMNPSQLDQNLRSTAKALVGRGFSFEEVSKQLGVTTHAVERWLKD